MLTMASVDCQTIEGVLQLMFDILVLIALNLLNAVEMPGGNLQTWLILPVVICLSQRLSHACLSISFYTAKLRMAH